MTADRSINLRKAVPPALTWSKKPERKKTTVTPAASGRQQRSCGLPKDPQWDWYFEMRKNGI